MAAQYDLTVTLNFTVEFDERGLLPDDVPHLGPRVKDKVKLAAQRKAQDAVREALEDGGLEGDDWQELADALGGDRAWCAAVESVKAWSFIQ